RRKQHRNRIYLACGAIIVACSAVMVSLAIKPVEKMLGPVHPLFVSETLSLFAFGVAWITKGEGLLKDPRKNHAGHTGGAGGDGALTCD
ncbi:MAG TPA: hypothetical protein VFJ52_08150, partial [Terriglobia bacterium]|nr:hypothetical protein [Terriglobia bacterium]